MSSIEIVRQARTDIPELLEIQKQLSRYRGNEARYWNTNRDFIAERLKNRLVIGAPNEVIIPIHKNGRDLPILLDSLANQNIDRVGPYSLTCLMHNNADVPEWGMRRDESWDQVAFLANSGVSVRVLQLTDPLLTGPYTSWQYALHMSQGSNVAVIDADSIITKNWLDRLTKPLDDNQDVVITGGQRVYLDAPSSVVVPSSAHYLLSIASHLTDNSGPHLVKGTRFYGGQAAYRGPVVRNLIGEIFGMTDGDVLFSEFLVNKFGLDAFAFANAPVADVPDKYRNSKNLRHYVERIRDGATVFLPDQLSTIVKPNNTPTERANKKLGMAHRYCPWTRVIIDSYRQLGRISNTEVLDALERTAAEQHFNDNSHYRSFMENCRTTGIIPGFNTEIYEDPQALLALINNLGTSIVRPTMKDYIQSQH
ncbi:MAG: glycosyltransferase family A protein [Patescibacteria group bacterium]